MKALTEKQKLAIKNLEKAVKQCGIDGLALFGMDLEICYITEKAVRQRIEFDSDTGKYYNEYADTFRAISLESPEDEIFGIIKTGNTYKDSGGW